MQRKLIPITFMIFCHVVSKQWSLWFTQHINNMLDLHIHYYQTTNKEDQSPSFTCRYN